MSLLALSAAIAFPAKADPLPVLGNVVQGDVAISSPSPTNMLVTQQSQTGIIAWDSFSVGAGNGVHFENGTGATLNRVTGNVASQIDGSLTATGSLYLINQNGIAVGNNGMVATGGSFYGSTQDLTNPDDIGSDDLTFSGTSEASVVNLGIIRSDQGDVALIARQVDNQGTISALNGTAALLGGYEVVARLTGDDNGKFSVSMGGFSDEVITSGIIEAMNVELRAHGGSVEALAGNTNSVVKATGVQQSGGRIFLTTNEGFQSITVRAPVVAKRPKAQPTQNWDGGDIVISGAIVDVDGLMSVAGAGTGVGGTISVSGEYQVLVSSDLDANGTTGGTINIHSGRSLSIDGQLTANGATGGAIGVTATTFANTGTIAANGSTGPAGTVSIAAETLVQHGTVEANSTGSSGGVVDLAYADGYIDVASSSTTASGTTGGLVRISATNATANHFSSGTISATGSHGLGGTVRLVAGDHLRLVGAMIDVTGTIGGGDIWLSRLGAEAEHILLASGTELRANGGTINYLTSQRAPVQQVGGPFANYELYSPNPTSAQFGSQVLTLANENVAVDGADGAAYLYDGRTGRLISSLIGGGFQRFEPLKNGNYLIVGSGGVTFANSESGVGGLVSNHNSLVGHSGPLTVLALKNGNYVVGSDWAVTFGNGTTGIAGSVDAGNSLVDSGHWFGSSSLYRFGEVIQELPSGNYVVTTSRWNSATVPTVGAVTFGNGWTGVSGEISEFNSLIGDQAGDRVGGGNDEYGLGPGVRILSNGDYVVLSGSWRTGGFGFLGGRGAVTLGDGMTGIAGVVSNTNSLVGTVATDTIGGSIADLGNGNFVVGSASWSNGSILRAGAATMIRKDRGGTFGEINPLNSLVGTTPGEAVGEYIVGLASGNYVVATPGWDNGTTQNVGAVTFGNGQSGIVGSVTSANSLTGSQTGDSAGYGGIWALANGNYVVASPEWDAGSVTNVGAVTWGNGSLGTIGLISSTNSLVGSQTNDSVGGYITALTDGNYAVSSPGWSNGAATNAGAVTWGDGTQGTIGPVTESNSLVGSVENQYLFALYRGRSGTYLIQGSGSLGGWTLGRAGGETVGVASPDNSLVGVEAYNPIFLTDGNVVIRSELYFGLGPLSATFFDMTVGTYGVVSSENSLIGVPTYASPTSVSLDSGALAYGAYYALLTEYEQTFDEQTFEFRDFFSSSFAYAPPGGRTGILSQQTADIVLHSEVAPYKISGHFLDGSGFLISGGEGRVIVFRTPIPQIDEPSMPTPLLPGTSGQSIERNLRMQVAAGGAEIVWLNAMENCPPQSVLGSECSLEPHPDNVASVPPSL